MPEPWPTEIRLAAGRKALSLAFDDGRRAAIPAELLRCESPSAEVQGHSAAGRKLVPGKRDVAITSIEPVGNYAVRLVFDDGHSTGIFDWTYLATLSEDPDGALARYRDKLREAGLSADPP